MGGIISRENIIKEKIENVREGEVVLELFKIAEELGIGNEIELQNSFSFHALEYAYKPIENQTNFKVDKVYTAIKNVYYVVELYLRGYYNKEHYMGYEEFLNLVKNGKTKEVIEASHSCFILHINRLKKIIAKSKKKIPRNNKFFRETKELLKEIDKDLSICERYPNTSANLSEFYFGRLHGICGPTVVKKMVGFIAMEKTVYSLYNELAILSKFKEEYINNICELYIKNIGAMIPFNLFEKAINNYLFALPYSDCPENLKISKVDAGLLIREVKLGTLSATELVDQLVDKYELTEYNVEYLKEYGTYIEKRIQTLKDSNYFGELFIVTPPD